MRRKNTKKTKIHICTIDALDSYDVYNTDDYDDDFSSDDFKL